ncbi:MAG TPA: hypothetical protein VH257_00390 [Chloroflexota bacterium]|nr:hypothetical protein [Chloroflexota bacterium]
MRERDAGSRAAEQQRAGRRASGDPSIRSETRPIGLPGNYSGPFLLMR